MQSHFTYSQAVQKAQAQNKPILALESTLITHGLPFPQNIETALAVEQLVYEHEVVPATIALMKGKIKIGLSAHELASLVQDNKVVKASRRDIPFILSQSLNAGTTVAATLFCAHQANIKVFATGGIGGVHRGNELDISADLIELARTPMAVVSSGAKAILDLPKTIEFLETYSVPVIGYRTESLPAFYTSTTPYPLFTSVNDLASLVKLLTIHWELNMSSAVLIANPIPKDQEIPEELIEPIIQSALQQSHQSHMTGKKVTPFLLQEIAKATHGQALIANIQLIKNNAKMGAMLAHALHYPLERNKSHVTNKTG